MHRFPFTRSGVWQQAELGVGPGGAHLTYGGLGYNSWKLCEN